VISGPDRSGIAFGLMIGPGMWALMIWLAWHFWTW
jgi:hypothetical protein